MAPVCRALQAVVEGDYDIAARELEATLPRAGVLGGSAAQREVLEDTLVYALARSGQGDRAAAVLDQPARPAPLAAGQSGAGTSYEVVGGAATTHDVL